MSSNFKSVPTAHADPVRAANLYRLAIVGAGTLKGKEVAEILGVSASSIDRQWAYARAWLHQHIAKGDTSPGETSEGVF